MVDGEEEAEPLTLYVVFCESGCERNSRNLDIVDGRRAERDMADGREGTGWSLCEDANQTIR